ncbi:MAG: class II glutamine amidotransferase [Ignavibacteriaceae bacterium]|nr:class II glutamine amidotransferase [Ignavibacteriaceae bacterium]
MCRLLYVSSNQTFSIAEHLKKFADIAKHSREYQGHGWGFAYLQNGSWNYYKNIKPIWQDDFSQFGNTSRLIAHARSAFRDEGIEIKNNMPFYDDKYIFIFNGELHGVKIREAGRIGAEKIFNYIKRFDKGNLKEAIQKGADIITKKSAYVKAMNIMMTNAGAVYVYSSFNEDEEYFTMHRKIMNDTLVICSKPFEGESDWEPIPNNSISEYKCL